MQTPEFTDEELMAYADGELDQARANALDLALVDDAGLADRLAVFVDTRAISREALEPALHQPAPAHLVQRVRDLAAADPTESETDDETVVAFAPRRRAEAQAPIWRLPLAAGLALAAGVTAGLYLAPQSGGGSGSIEIATLVDPALIDALNTLPSGEATMLGTGARIEPVATFLDGAQTLCREFEFDRTDGITVISVACQNAGQWDVQLAIAASSPDGAGYVPASSLEALNAYLTASDAGLPLSLEAEAQALEQLR